VTRVIAFDPVCAALAEGLGLSVEPGPVEPAADDIVLVAGVDGLRRLASWRSAGMQVRVVLRTGEPQLERERLEPVALLRESSPRALRRALEALDEGQELLPIVIEHGVVDLKRRRFEGPDGPKRLTELECKLLAYLATRPGREVSRQELQAQVWGHRASLKTRAVDMVVFRLRRKIEAHPEEPTSLLTAHGGGYRLVPGYSPPAAPVASPVQGVRSRAPVRLALLEPGAARELLDRSLLEVGEERDEAWRVQTLDLLDGVPSFIDAAGRIALPVASLERCLSGEGPPRLQKVLDGLDAALDDLTEPEAALLTGLARLRHLELGGLSEFGDGAWTGVERLRARGLVHREGDRLRVPSPIAVRARLRLPDTPEAATARRRWLRGLAQEVAAASQGFEARTTALRLIPLRVDLTAAIHDAIEAGEHDVALDLMAGRQSLGAEGGRATERASECERLLPMLPVALRPRCLLLLCGAQANHQRARAIEALTEGLATAVDPDVDAQLRAHAAYLLPFVGRVDEALERVSSPPAGCSPFFARRLAAEAVRVSCRKQRYSGPEVIERLQQATDELLEGGDLQAGIRLGRALATAQQSDGHLDDAELTLRRLLVWQQSLANRTQEVGLEVQKALLVWGRQRREEALEGLARAQASVDEVEPGWADAFIAVYQGGILLQLSRHAEARERADSCRRWAVRQKSTADRLFADVTLSLIEADLGRAERSELLADRALEGCEPDQSPFVQGLLRTQLARALVEQGRCGEALDALEPTRLDQLSAAPLAELHAVALLAHHGLGQEITAPLRALSETLHGAEFPAADELRGLRDAFRSGEGLDAALDVLGASPLVESRILARAWRAVEGHALS
jgi:DNA-binding response OmpR family regulator